MMWNDAALLRFLLDPREQDVQWSIDSRSGEVLLECPDCGAEARLDETEFADHGFRFLHRRWCPTRWTCPTEELVN
jgi:hypothetical protein